MADAIEVISNMTAEVMVAVLHIAGAAQESSVIDAVVKLRADRDSLLSQRDSMVDVMNKMRDQIEESRTRLQVHEECAAAHASLREQLAEARMEQNRLRSERDAAERDALRAREEGRRVERERIRELARETEDAIDFVRAIIEDP